MSATKITMKWKKIHFPFLKIYHRNIAHGLSKNEKLGLEFFVKFPQTLVKKLYKPIITIAAKNALRKTRPIIIENGMRHIRSRLFLKALRFMKHKKAFRT
jgi:hypothetical protein